MIQNILYRLILILGGLNCFLTTFFQGYNQFITRLTTTRPYITTILGGLLGISTLMLLFDRNYYLPFLGPCVIPIQETNFVSSKVQKQTTTRVKLTGLPANVSVVYWAAVPKLDSKLYQSYKEAYGDYSNSGVVNSNETGEAVIGISCPSQYSVKKFGILQTELPKHVHYRYELPGNRGLYSEVFTKNINC